MDLEWIEKGLRKKDKTKRGLAKALGVSPSAISHMFNGIRQIKATELPAIAEYLEEPLPEAYAQKGTIRLTDEQLLAVLDLVIKLKIECGMPREDARRAAVRALRAILDFEGLADAETAALRSLDRLLLEPPVAQAPRRPTRG